VNTPNDGNCANGDFCDGDETCDALLDCQAGTPVSVDDGVVCTDDSCDEVGDVVVNTPNDGNCANGDFCDGDETCDALLDCQAGTPPGDGVACTDDSCDEILDVVTGTPNDANCDNGQFCDGDETCDALLDCLAGTPPPLTPDSVACTDAACDEANDRIEQLPNHSLCQNSTVCDGTEVCHPIFDCEVDPFGPLDCDDGDICTADACDAVTGCSNAPIAGCAPVPAASPGGRALLSLLVVGAGALLLSRRRSQVG
jgi:hypothetical protein